MGISWIKTSLGRKVECAISGHDRRLCEEVFCELESQEKSLTSGNVRPRKPQPGNFARLVYPRTTLHMYGLRPGRENLAVRRHLLGAGMAAHDLTLDEINDVMVHAF